MAKSPRVTERKRAGRDHAVATVVGGEPTYRREPCAECPWRKDRVGSFPAEAFRISARTADDGAMEAFACHMSGANKPSVCAGFLLRNADHNITVRLRRADGRIDLARVHDGGIELHESYRDMAIANGVEPDDPALADCRANGEMARTGGAACKVWRRLRAKN